MIDQVIVTVFVEALVTVNELDFDDRDYSQEVLVSLNKGVKEEDYCSAALDIYNASVDVSCAENFSFTVMKDGVLLQEKEDHEGYAMRNCGFVL